MTFAFPGAFSEEIDNFFNVFIEHDVLYSYLKKKLGLYMYHLLFYVPDFITYRPNFTICTQTRKRKIKGLGKEF